MLSSRNKNRTIVGLEIETGSIAATEVSLNGSPRVVRTAVAPLTPGAFNEGEVLDPEGLGHALKQMFAEHRLSKAVRLGVANQRIIARTLVLPLIEDPEELETAVRFQAQDEIPMPLDQAVLDHQVTAKRNDPSGGRQMEVVAVAARRDMVARMLEAVRAAGLKPIGIDLSAFGMIRALAGELEGATVSVGAVDEDDWYEEPDMGELPVPATLYCGLGDVTNLAVARGSSCLFTRVSTFGVDAIAQRLAERRGIPLDRARNEIARVGLDGDVDAADDDSTAAREALADGASKLVDELRLSLEYYGAQENAPAIERIVVCGPGTTIRGLPEQIGTDLGRAVETAIPSALGGLTPTESARLTVPYGLALEE